MPMQRALFPEAGIDSQVELPQGFRYEEAVITEAEENALVTNLAELDLKPFEFHGHIGNRRVKSFGFRYDYSRSTVEAAESFPPFLDELRRRVAKFAGRSIEEFRQAGVNQYPAGAGIGWHRDKPQFGVIVGVSLIAPATMRFRRAHGKRWIRKSQVVLPRSIYMMDGEARRVWEHSIPPLDHLRYSLTFRTLSDNLATPPA